ncbi:hypothetical protein [Deinococcus sp.]|uniref:hypothetical protein n=1 Tax=Deinococcus sp. TaxID=47478 RepID=UPI003C7DCD00
MEIIAPKDTQTAFLTFLNARSASLEAISMAALFDLILDFCQTVRLDQCAVPDDDYLHCEVYENKFYFERLMYVPMELMYEDDVGENKGYREKWGLFIQPEATAFAQAPVVPNINLFSFEFADIDSFAEAVRALPSMQWAASQNAVRVEANLDQVG